MLNCFLFKLLYVCAPQIALIDTPPLLTSINFTDNLHKGMKGQEFAFFKFCPSMHGLKLAKLSHLQFAHLSKTVVIQMCVDEDSTGKT